MRKQLILVTKSDAEATSSAIMQRSVLPDLTDLFSPIRVFQLFLFVSPWMPAFPALVKAATLPAAKTVLLSQSNRYAMRYILPDPIRQSTFLVLLIL